MKNTFANKVVLITGHTGFKGSWLSLWLSHLGADVHGISLPDPISFPSHFGITQGSYSITNHFYDISNPLEISKVIKEIKPQFIFHLAAQSLVNKSYQNPLETFQTNVIGSINILEAVRFIDHPCNVVMVTSDKCYENVEWVWGYRENDRLGGEDPYSASKGAAELVIHSYVASLLPNCGPVRLATVRAGNVIGGGDWAESRIVPDCMRSWGSGEVVELRNPLSTRPWQHVLEPLGGYLLLAKNLNDCQLLHGEAFNFGPNSEQNRSVAELVGALSLRWPGTDWKDASKLTKSFKEAGLLKLNCDKALNLLGWKSLLKFTDTVEMTVEWYKNYYENKGDIAEYSLGQINSYMKRIKNDV
ncbi:CDP-glucose 4,6-dehydratase [Polynucleobacter sp. Adler-ghost]|uniref:CDP-glucose 4,6-dehydratase n=1 Tax=Polynucleobacter sp. Adler-ghost TaxID=2770234 RepID=UPI001BFCE8C6|nr:CDP-glucose 4,6-dehydratase [Polynucleobacter sp. Adler-ghost]QWE31059.1 CDP-glucose 4,6-dehydratase [Polynucleobacter sp. Adler-ghost]